MQTIRGHFWYSEKQKNERKRQGLFSVYCIIDGMVSKTEYTMWTDSKKNPAKFDDMIYLGEGLLTDF